MQKRIIVTTAVIVLSVISSGVWAETVWQIGKTDRDYHDLAFDGDFNNYNRHFPRDVNFVVGQNDPGKDFSAAHPGPADRWAGSRQHPFNIRFDLADTPKGFYELLVNIVDTDINASPTLQVSVNGLSAKNILERGTGQRVIARPRQGKARNLKYVFGPDHLKKGANLIELRITQGTWLIYDSVILNKLPENYIPEINLVVKPSIFYVEKQGKLKQEFSISVTGVAIQGPLQVKVHAGTKQLEAFTVKKSFLGTLSDVFHLTPAVETREITVSVSAGKQNAATTVTQKPTKKWRIFEAPSTHTDIGYTDIQDRVIDMHNRNTDLALQLINDFPLYHWNLESSWAAQVWLQDVPRYQHEQLYEAARQRRIGIESSYLNMLTGLCSGEELIRNLYYSARMHREHGIPFESHTLTDAPSHVWTVPSILAGAGIKCVSFGINATRAPILKQNIHHKSPFWWEGPDGARVLTWFSAGYASAYRIGLKDGVERMRAMVESYLYWWDHREDYPYDAVLLHGAYGDNAKIGGDIAETLTEYSKKYAYPKVILCSNKDFANYIIENFEDKIPVVRGCGGSWWEDGAGSSAVETAANRVAHQDVVTAETIWAAALEKRQDVSFPQHNFDNIWDNILLYDEHTWGAHNSIREPNIDFVHRQFAVKAAYADNAAAKSRRLIERGLDVLAGRVVADKGSMVVFNPSGRERTGVVRALSPRGSVIMGKDGAVPQQVTQEDELNNVTVAFLAENVPAVGYRTYSVSNAPSNFEVPVRFKGNVLENNFYRVQFDPAGGGIVSLKDKHLDKELVDQASSYKLGQLIYAAGGEEQKGVTQNLCPNPSKIKFVSPHGAKIQAGARGPVFSSARSVCSMNMFPRIEMEVILYEHDKRMDFVFRLRKDMTYDKEALYIAFPVAGNNPQFRYEIGGGNVRPNEDHFPGGCRDWFSVQRWVTVNTDDRAVAWTPVDTPLITLCDMNAGKWLDKLPITNGTIFAYTMNNYWFTNYKAGQDGNFTFRYSLTSDKSIDPMEATRFGESVVADMQAVRKHGKRKAADLPTSKSFVSIQPKNVIVSTVKRSDDGKGLIVRVQETAGKDTEVKLAVGFKDIAKASGCDLVERATGPLAINNGTVSFRVKANSLATVRLE